MDEPDSYTEPYHVREYGCRSFVGSATASAENTSALPPEIPFLKVQSPRIVDEIVDMAFPHA